MTTSDSGQQLLQGTVLDAQGLLLRGREAHGIEVAQGGLPPLQAPDHLAPDAPRPTMPTVECHSS